MSQPSERAPADPAGERSTPRGCTVSLVLLAVAIVGLARSCYLPADRDMTTVIVPGKTWRLAVSSNIETVNGLGRLDDMKATLKLDGEAAEIALPIQGKPQDTWGADTEISIVTVKGVPVASGKEDIALGFEVEIPDRAEWLGRKGDLRVQAHLVYPTFGFDQALVGAHTGSLTIEEKSYDYDATFEATVAKSNPDAAAKRRRERLLDFGLMVLLLFSIVLGFWSARHLPDAKEDENPSA